MSETVKTNRFTFTWKIENFSSCYEKLGDEISSPSFIAENLSGSRWYISFYPRGVSKEDRDYVSLYLCKFKGNHCNDKLFITYEISILLSNGKVIETIKNDSEFQSDEGYGNPDFMKTNELLEHMEKTKDDTLIIVCRITRKKKSSKKAVSCVAKTRVGVNRFSYFWTVPFNFNLEGWSEIKKFGLNDSYVLEVLLTCPDNDILICIRLIRPDITSSMLVTCRLVLLDTSEIEYCSKSDVNRFKSDKFWSFPSFFTKEHLENEKDTFIQNGNFYLMLYFSSSSGTKINEIEQYMYEESKTLSVTECETHLTLCNDFQNMLKRKEHCDVQIQVCDQNIPAHKCVLSSRSPVFKTMFEQNMTETETGVVNITDHDVITVYSFLDFVYSGSFDNMDIGLALKVLLMADKYEVSSLEKKCTTFLESVLSEENACEILLISDLVVEKSLKKSAVNFITNHADKVLLSPQWSALVEENCKLGSEVLTQLSKQFGTSLCNFESRI